MSRRTYILLLLLSQALSGSGQCSGNLGENIFLAGDFGTGVANIVQNDPGLAPGFQYTTFVPIDDGEYVLTNDMAKWPSIYPTWLRIGDNSTDPNSYMMVVNASFAPGIFFEQTIDGLCDNTLYEFSADVINVVRQSVTGHIFPNVSFLIDNVEKFTTGPIPQTEQWKTFGFTFITAPGQEQVTLTLRNNAPGGIGNDLALDNISFRPCGPSAAIHIDMDGRVCENVLYPTLSAIIGSDTGFVQWQISTDLGMTWMDIPGATNRSYRSDQLSAQNYFFRYMYGKTQKHLQNEKCRIVSASKLLVVVPVNFTIYDTLCTGLSFNLGGALYNTSGTYFEHLTAANGCDSLVTLHLTIVPDAHIESEVMTIPPTCAGYEDGMITVTGANNGVPPYFVSLGDQSVLVPVDIPFSVTAGNYSVIVSDRYGCVDVQVVDIIDPEPFILTVIGEDELILGHSLTLAASGNYPIQMIEWNPATGLSCITCAFTDATPLSTTTYVAVAVSDKGCLSSDSIRINVNTQPRIYIPNVFSPNGDQVNDSWGVYADPLNISSIKRAMIFDRWGNVVYETSNITSIDALQVWDGRRTSELPLPGVYVFLLELIMADNTVIKQTGTVTVVR